MDGWGRTVSGVNVGGGLYGLCILLNSAFTADARPAEFISLPPVLLSIVSGRAQNTAGLVCFVSGGRRTPDDEWKLRRGRKKKACPITVAWVA